MNSQLNDNKHIKKYVSHIPSEIEVSNFMVVVFLLPAMFVLIPIFAPPFELLYAVLVLPPFFVMAIVAVWYMIISRKDGKKYQNITFFLIKGLYGVVGSIGCFFIIQKFAYNMLGLTSPLFFLLSFSGYGVVLYFFFKDQIMTVYEDKSKRDKKNKKASGTRVIKKTASTFAFLGYLAGTMSLRIISDNTMYIIMIGLYFMISYIFFYHMLELHRYFLIKKVTKQN
ncbi:hypothetical protein [Fredinandcohnia sp. 179-A 10B2 NHS]|uniref:hypothetical protein n=1 Tax=Fredinandcohnia sp. 179-A 10B2 NHS TaxID=3235176 RepID=UPI0039A3F82C